MLFAHIDIDAASPRSDCEGGSEAASFHCDGDAAPTPCDLATLAWLPARRRRRRPQQGARIGHAEREAEQLPASTSCVDDAWLHETSGELSVVETASPPPSAVEGGSTPRGVTLVFPPCSEGEEHCEGVERAGCDDRAPRGALVAPAADAPLGQERAHGDASPCPSADGHKERPQPTIQDLIDALHVC